MLMLSPAAEAATPRSLKMVVGRTLMQNEPMTEEQKAFERGRDAARAFGGGGAFDDEDPFGDPKREASPLEIAIVLAVYGGIFLIGYVIWGAILYLMRSFLLALPEQYRLMPPNQVFLALIPCFHLFWIFMITSKISHSYQQYFHQLGRHDVGKCGEGVGLAYCICAVTGTVLGAIPCIGPCFGGPLGLASLILLIIYLVTIFGLKSQINMMPKSPMPPMQPMA